MHRYRLFCLSALLLFLYITNIQAQEPYFEPTPTICEGFMQSQLIVGDYGRVTPGSPNNVRAEPSTGAEKIGEIPGDRRFTVLEGPFCGEGMAWWKVDYRGLVGWTVEGIGSEYFLLPGPETCESMFEVGEQAELISYRDEALYSEPNEQSTVLATVREYTTVTITGESQCDESRYQVFTPVEYNGVSGWVIEIFYGYCDYACDGGRFMASNYRIPLIPLEPTNRVIEPAAIPIRAADNAISAANVNQMQNTKIIGDGLISSPSWSGDEEFIGLFNGSDYQIYKVRQMNVGPVVFKDRNGTFRPNNNQVAIIADRQIDIYNVNDLTTVESTLSDFNGDIFRAAYSPDGRVLVTVDTTDGVKIWDAETLTLIDSAPKLDGEDRYTQLHFSENSHYLVMTGQIEKFYQWDFTDLSNVVRVERVLDFALHNARITFATQDFLYAITLDLAVRIINDQANSVINIDTLPGSGALSFRDFSFSLDGSRFIAIRNESGGHPGGPTRDLLLGWDTTTGNEVSRTVISDYLDPENQFIQFEFLGDRTFIIVNDEIRSGYTLKLGGIPTAIAFNDPYIFVGRTDGTVTQFHKEQGAVKVLYGINARVKNIMLSPSQRYVTAVGDDNSLRVWEVESGTRLGSVVYKNLAGPIHINPQGTKAINGRMLWNLNTGESSEWLDAETPITELIAITSDGKIIYVSQSTTAVKDITTDTTETFNIHENLGLEEYIAESTTNDGRYVIKVRNKGNVSQLAVFDLFEDSFVLHLENAFEYISGTKLSRFGNLLLVDDQGQITQEGVKREREGITIWDIGTGELLRYFPTSSNMFPSEFNPDETKILVLSREENDATGIHILDLTTLETKQIRLFERKFLYGSPVLFSRDSSLIIFTDALGYINFLDAETGETLHQIETAKVYSASYTPVGLAISEDGSKLFTTGGDGVLRVWEIVP